MTNLVFLDTETTGLDPGRHEIWEIAYILRTASYEKICSTMLPVDLSTADPTALRNNRFYDRYFDKEAAKTTVPQSWALQLARETAGAHLVGMVPSFDAAFLDKWLRRFNFAPAWHYHLIDAESLVAGYLGLTPPWNSEELSRTAGIEPPLENERHTALGDAQWAMRLYDKVLKNVS